MRKTHMHVVFVVATLLACSACAFALDPSLEISQYAHTAWRVRDGFAKGEIASIAQTPDGYLWLGTEFGLFRFDGVRAVPWQPPGNQHLPPGSIFSLLVSRDGTLWIGARGLATWKNGKLTQYSELDGQLIYALLEDRDGTIWVGAGGTPTAGRICAIRSASIDCFGGDGRLGPGVVALHEDPHGNLWAGVKDGLWRWKPGAPKFYSVPSESDGIQAIADDTDGTLLIGWKGGIYRFIDGKTEPYLLTTRLHQFRAVRILRDRNGGLWIGTFDRGLVHVHEGRTDVFLSTDTLSGDLVVTLFEDREGSIWISTSEGLDRFRNFCAATLTVKQGLSRALVASVLADEEGSVWLATYGGLNRWHDGEITIPPTGSAKQDGTINGFPPNSLFQDDRGRIWASTSRGLGYLEKGRFSVIKGVPAGNVLSITQDIAANLWMIVEPVGLVRISPQRDVRQIVWADLGHKDNASVLAADRKQDGLWIGFFGGGIAHFADGQVRASYTAADGLGAGRVSDFQFDDDGSLWVSTEGGLSRLKKNRVATLTSKNGLPCDAVHWAVEGDDRSLWLYTACGLVQIARSELDAWATAADKGQDARRAIRVRVFDSSDGIRSLFQAGHYHPQIAKAPDGKLWFLPWDGVSVIDPHHIPFNKAPPPVHVEQVIADRKTYDAAPDANENMRLPPHVRDLEIDYTALSLVAPEKVLFRYKLEGLDRDWRDVGNRRQAFYTDLPPGNYRFRVAACNNSGVWNEGGASLDFSVAPAYYQTNCFRLSCVAAALASIWGLYQLRLRQLAREFNMRLDERVTERTRIARELHDTLLQNVQGLILKIHAIAKRIPAADPSRQDIEKTLDYADQVLTEGRDRVRSLRSPTVSSGDLPAAFQKAAEESSPNRTATLKTIVEGGVRELNPMVLEESYSVGREAIINALTHSACLNIEVEIIYDSREFRLRIRDDGGGIDPGILEAGGRADHWGLQGMRERAHRLGGKLDLWSRPGSGTEVELTVPASTAYRSPRRKSTDRSRISAAG